MHETYHTGSDLSTVKSRFVFLSVDASVFAYATPRQGVRQGRVLRRSSVAEALEDSRQPAEQFFAKLFSKKR